MTLGLSVAPRLTNGIPDSSEIMPDGIGESAQSIQARSVRIVQPGIEFGGVLASQDAPESTPQPLRLHAQIRSDYLEL